LARGSRRSSKESILSFESSFEDGGSTIPSDQASLGGRGEGLPGITPMLKAVGQALKEAGTCKLSKPSSRHNSNKGSKKSSRDASRRNSEGSGGTPMLHEDEMDPVSEAIKSAQASLNLES